jgi:RNA polymerase sigma factor for flagellar operon FliA
MPLDADEIELWLSYRPGNSREAHQELFFRYVPWSKSVARAVYRRIRVPMVEWADYAHNATVGLLEAMSRFEATRGIDFTGYAKARVRGSVFNGLRSFLADYRRREAPHRMQERLESFQEAEGEDVLGQIISSISGLGIGFLLDSVASADVMQTDQDPGDVAERHQMDVLLKSAMERLKGKERMVMGLHYEQHMPFVDIAKLLGLTKGRISQIHHAAIARMRREIRGDDAISA